MSEKGKPHRFAVGNTWGRPPVYDNEDQFASKILEYFTECQQTKERPTITGLSLYVGFESRSTFDKQAARSPEFSYIVKRAKMIVENEYEQLLTTVAVTGAIFALKQMGWSDKVDQKIELDADVKNVIEFADYDKLSDSALEEIARAVTDTSQGGTGEA